MTKRRRATDIERLANNLYQKDRRNGREYFPLTHYKTIVEKAALEAESRPILSTPRTDIPKAVYIGWVQTWKQRTKVLLEGAIERAQEEKLVTRK